MVTVVMLSREGCAESQRVAKLFSMAGKAIGSGARFVEYDVSELPDTLSGYADESVPLILFFVDGVEKARLFSRITYDAIIEFYHKVK